MNMPKIAYDMLIKTLDLELQFKEPYQICSTYSNISTILSSLGRHDDALKYAQVSLDIFDKIVNEENSEKVELIMSKIDTQIKKKEKEYLQ
mmetsp:Transcript_50208/g.42386  ORF Transcript_50208/g.42386 Transcript_50208/m.42386 type:complete len:91 (-) Transcript_50208:1019-1291(-)